MKANFLVFFKIILYTSLPSLLFILHSTCQGAGVRTRYTQFCKRSHTRGHALAYISKHEKPISLLFFLCVQKYIRMYSRCSTFIFKIIITLLFFFFFSPFVCFILLKSIRMKKTSIQKLWAAQNCRWFKIGCLNY